MFSISRPMVEPVKPLVLDSVSSISLIAKPIIIKYIILKFVNKNFIKPFQLVQLSIFVSIFLPNSSSFQVNQFNPFVQTIISFNSRSIRPGPVPITLITSSNLDRSGTKKDPIVKFNDQNGPKNYKYQ